MLQNVTKIQAQRNHSVFLSHNSILFSVSELVSTSVSSCNTKGLRENVLKCVVDEFGRTNNRPSSECGYTQEEEKEQQSCFKKMSLQSLTLTEVCAVCLIAKGVFVFCG